MVKASSNTVKVKKALGEHATVVKVQSMRGFLDTSVRSKELEAVTRARAILVEAGLDCSAIVTYKALGPTFYVRF